MAALDFPAGPSVNDTYSANGRTWKWNGETWRTVPQQGASGASPLDFPIAPAPDDTYSHDGWEWQWNGESWVSLGEAEPVGSNLVAAVGGFNAPSSGTTGVTCSVSGLSFQPVFVFLWMVGRTETDDTPALNTASSKASFGMFNATTQYTWGSGHTHAGANSNSGMIHRTDCCIMKGPVEFGGSANLYRGMNLSSINSDGFTLAIHSSSTLAWAGERIQYLALGGSDLSSSKMGSFSITAGTGNQSSTGPGFQPVALLFPNVPLSPGTVTGPVALMLGAATGASNQFVWGGQCDHNVATMDTARYLITTECHGQFDTGGAGIGARLRFVSLDATGFTYNRLESATVTGFYGALGGAISAYVGTFTAASGGGSVTGVGFTPKAILFLTHGTTQSTADTPQQDMMYSIGACVAGVTQRCSHLHDVDNQANTVVGRGHRDDSVIMTSDATPALDSRITISSLDSDGFTYTMPTSTLNGYLVGYLALG
jgi:uncharacterized spore protein YtfJ